MRNKWVLGYHSNLNNRDQWNLLPVELGAVAMPLCSQETVINVLGRGRMDIQLPHCNHFKHSRRDKTRASIRDKLLITIPSFLLFPCIAICCYLNPSLPKKEERSHLQGMGWAHRTWFYIERSHETAWKKQLQPGEEETSFRPRNWQAKTSGRCPEVSV